MGRVVYITGAPATGKSTVCRTLASSGRNIHAFCYSERLRDHVALDAGMVLGEVDIRRESARIVTSRHVEEVDELLLREAKAVRGSGSHLLIDSHPVTKELYGFRVTPFSAERLRALDVDTFICLYAPPNVLADRIARDAQGRPLPGGFDLSLHVQLQASVVAQYAVLAGTPCYLLDSTVSPEALAARVLELAKL